MPCSWASSWVSGRIQPSPPPVRSLRPHLGSNNTTFFMYPTYNQQIASSITTPLWKISQCSLAQIVTPLRFANSPNLIWVLVNADLEHIICARMERKISSSCVALLGADCGHVPQIQNHFSRRMDLCWCCEAKIIKLMRTTARFDAAGEGTSRGPPLLATNNRNDASLRFLNLSENSI